MVKEGASFEENSNVEEMISNLKGNTLLVYWFLIRKNRPFTARDIQRKTGLSSPSLALHHLNKLIELGLVRIDKEGHYTIKQHVKPGLLRFFIGSGYLFLPRFALYAILSTSLLISCIYAFLGRFDAPSIVLILTLGMMSAIFWFESFNLWHSQPI